MRALAKHISVGLGAPHKLEGVKWVEVCQSRHEAEWHRQQVKQDRPDLRAKIQFREIKVDGLAVGVFVVVVRAKEEK